MKYEKNVIYNYPNIDLLKSGDIILRRAYGVDSNVAVNFSDGEKRYSHAGIIFKDSNNTFVIHSIDDTVLNYHGVIQETLDEYLKKIKIWSIYRYTDNIVSQNKIANESITLLKKNILFDNEFDLNSNNKMYCSEFILKVINKALNKKLIIPKKIFLRRKFVTISNLYENHYAKLIQNSHLYLSRNIRR